MGLGSFRWRLVIVLIVGLLLWQTSKIWLAFLQDDGAVAAQELQADQAATPLAQKDDPAQQRVHVAVYYEALCPDSRSFVIRQLGPTYQKLSANIKIEFVPYGKAQYVKKFEVPYVEDSIGYKNFKSVSQLVPEIHQIVIIWYRTVQLFCNTMKTHDGYAFTCQHGPIECQANIIHACSVDVIEDPSVRLQFVTCMIENNIDPVGIMNTCAGRISVDLESIKKCTTTSKGKELLAKYGEMTSSLVPRVSFIPTVTLDGSSANQAKVLKNLLKEVCLHFKVIPKECVL